MHCDYLNITVPESSAAPVEKELLPIISGIGAAAVFQGTYKLATGGTFKAEAKRGFQFYSASGDFLAALRANKVYQSYLMTFAGFPHNISLMHIAHDIPCDAPPVISALRSRCSSPGGIRLTRKRLDPARQVKALLSTREDGAETGTLYLGNRKAEVWAKVYDKQHERLQNARKTIAPMTRYELAVSGKAAAKPSLRDADSPAALFWHYMSDVLTPPDDVPAWIAGGEGFSLPPRVALLPVEALRRLVESSSQLDQMFELAESCGPHGYRLLARYLCERLDRHSNNHAASDGHALRTGLVAES